MNATEELTIEQRVAAGASYLDKLDPWWHERIDLTTLDMDSCSACILGQLFGNYWIGPLADDPPYSLDELSAYERQAAPLGFTYARDLAGYAGDDELAKLAVEWRRLIESRRAVA